MIAFIPVTFAELAPEWFAERREIVQRDGYALRGAPCAGGHTIEVKSLTTNEWQPLGWHAGALCFATAAERDAALGKLQ
jgi:hypothetical protein